MKYETIKKYYDKGYWTIDMVRQAVVKKVITKAQFKKITGQAY